MATDTIGQSKQSRKEKQRRFYSSDWEEENKTFWLKQQFYREHISRKILVNEMIVAKEDSRCSDKDYRLPQLSSNEENSRKQKFDCSNKDFK